jgi:hypothetical protein
MCIPSANWCFGGTYHLRLQVRKWAEQEIDVQQVVRQTQLKFAKVPPYCMLWVDAKLHNSWRWHLTEIREQLDALGVHEIGGWVSKVGLEAGQERKISCPCLHPNPSSSNASFKIILSILQMQFSRRLKTVSTITTEVSSGLYRYAICLIVTKILERYFSLNFSI